MSSIDETVQACKRAGHGFPAGVAPVQSDLKRETSLVGMAYLNYIYANDFANDHFCQAMLLMSAQVPAGTANPFVALFTPEHAVATMGALADVQLALDLAIARSNPAPEKMQASLTTLRAIVE
jgi:hypothetical protein